MILPMAAPIRRASAQQPIGAVNQDAVSPWSGISFVLRWGVTPPDQGSRHGLCCTGKRYSFVRQPGRSGWEALPLASTRMRKNLEILVSAVESAIITTKQRGSSRCRNRLSSSLYLPRPWPAACRTRRHAALPVPLRVPLSPTRWMKTCWPARQSAVLPVRQPAGSSLACHPATRVTDTADGRSASVTQAIRADRPGGRSISCVRRGPACSRRS